MSFVLARPSIQHSAVNVLSATTEAGLTVTEPTPDIANDGVLRLRCSGTPTAAVDIEAQLQTSGAPNGYPEAGASVIWRQTGGSATSWRGYVDSLTLVRVAHPIAWGDPVIGVSSPRELPSGSLGLVVVTNPGGGVYAVTFHTITTAWVSSSVAVANTDTLAVRPELVVMPSGRLLIFAHSYVYYSDDAGVTWTQGAAQAVLNTATHNVICAEVVGDDVVMIGAASAGGVVSNVGVSRDGGFTWTITDSAVTLDDPRTCVLDGVVYVAERAAVSSYIYTLVPGGALVAVGSGGVSTNDAVAIVAREDGVLWLMSWQGTGANSMNGYQNYSVDGGVTWATQSKYLDAIKTGYGTNGLINMAGGMFNGQMVVVATADSSTGSDSGLHFLCFGEWSTYPETGVRIGYVPFDYPDALTWTATATGAGATITNRPYLKIVSTLGNGETYTAPAGVWSPAVADLKQVKLRFKVESGGSLASSDAAIKLAIGDGANQQGVTIRFTTTGARCYDTAGAQVGADLTATLTTWTDMLIVFKHDASAGAYGLVSVWYQQDGGDGIYTQWLNLEHVPEQAGVSVTTLKWVTVNLATTGLGMLVVSDGTLATTNPTNLRGRPLSPAYDVRVTSGVNLGAYGTGGISGDVYGVATRYTYGADNVWAELRPSRRVQSTSDNTVWALNFDRGANDLFHGNVVAVFGTNMRTATFHMSTTSDFAATPISVTLDATLTTFAATTGGLGYVLAANTNWRIGQWKSNGDSRRYFLQVGTAVYEITDNDETRLYVTAVDLSAATGTTCTIFGDRMAARLSGMALYRYMRFYVASGQTADDCYRVGSLIFDRAFTPEQLYDFGFVDRLEPNVTTTETESGSVLSYRRGPALATLSIQWPPLDKMRIDAEDRIADFYRGCEGSLTPVLLWRDTADLTTLALVQIREVLSRSNVRGEGTDALTRIDQLVLREIW